MWAEGLTAQFTKPRAYGFDWYYSIGVIPRRERQERPREGTHPLTVQFTKPRAYGFMALTCILFHWNGMWS